MGDNDNGAFLKDISVFLNKILFSFRVKHGGGFIEYEYLRFFQQGPGKRQSLLLATGKFYSLFADYGLIAIRELDYKFMCMCRSGRIFNFFQVCIRFSKEYVFSN